MLPITGRFSTLIHKIKGLWNENYSTKSYESEKRCQKLCDQKVYGVMYTQIPTGHDGVENDFCKNTSWWFQQAKISRLSAKRSYQ